MNIDAERERFARANPGLIIDLFVATKEPGVYLIQVREPRPELTVAVRIEAARKALGVSNRSLALQLGMDRSTLIRLERGGIAPSLHTIRRVATALGVRWQWLVTGEGAMQ